MKIANLNKILRLLLEDVRLFIHQLFYPAVLGTYLFKLLELFNTNKTDKISEKFSIIIYITFIHIINFVLSYRYYKAKKEVEKKAKIQFSCFNIFIDDLVDAFFVCSLYFSLVCVEKEVFWEYYIIMICFGLIIILINFFSKILNSRHKYIRIISIMICLFILSVLCYPVILGQWVIDNHDKTIYSLLVFSIAGIVYYFCFPSKETMVDIFIRALRNGQTKIANKKINLI